MKKMRRLIPAIAMLLVSAVMLSTASFAWFTMNDQVTASGMQVQAKAAGNLLISTAPMTAAAKDISVDFSNVAKKNLKPITFIAGTDDGAGNITAGKWETVGSNTKVDTLYGTVLEGDMTTVTNLATDATGDYFYEQTIYLATAGTAYTAPLIVNIEALSGAAEKIANAYTIALLVDDNTDWNAPDLVYSLHNKNIDGKVDVSAGEFEIPSTYGTTADTAVGLKVVIRIYVDGALETTPSTAQKKVLAEVAENTKYDPTTMADWTFYSSNNENAVVDKTGFTAETNLTQLGITHSWNGNAYTTESDITTYYVNNANVPTVGTTFSMSFKAVDSNAND